MCQDTCYEEQWKLVSSSTEFENWFLWYSHCYVTRKSLDCFYTTEPGEITQFTGLFEVL